MASSSHSNNGNQFFKNIIEGGIEEEAVEEEEDDREEDDLLQLKLGSGSGGTLCRKTVGNDDSNPVSRSHSLGLGLGLKLWPNIEKKGSDMVGVRVARRFIGRLPSWQMDSQDWYKPTPPAHSHHYSHTNPHHSGFWFTLLSSTNQRGEALPQVPKAYIRVMDDDITIFIIKKYLVTKLGLSNENEIEILCMGQRLVNVQSLKVVRDTIWIPALLDSLNSTSESLADSDGMPSPNIMLLIYQKHPLSYNSHNL